MPTVSRHQFTRAADALSFMTSGKAIITAANPQTGRRFTFKVTAANEGEAFFVSVKKDGRFVYMGIIDRAKQFKRTGKSRVQPDESEFIAFTWVYANLKAGQIKAPLEVWHEGRCGRCGRTLTVPTSIARGIGPECAGKFLRNSQFVTRPQQANLLLPTPKKPGLDEIDLIEKGEVPW